MENNEIYFNGLVKTYHSAGVTYNTPVKRLSDRKREIVSFGLPLTVIYGKTEGIVELNDRGDIVVTFSMINGVEFKNGFKCYLIDADDEMLKNCICFKM